MINWRAILENPAALVGLLRAVAILAMGFGATWFTENDVENAVVALSQLIALVSLAFSGISTVATNRMIETARAEDPNPPAG